MCWDILTASMTVHPKYVVVVPMHQNFRQVWTAMWILEIKPGFSERAASAVLRAEEFFQAPQFCF